MHVALSMRALLPFLFVTVVTATGLAKSAQDIVRASDFDEAFLTELVKQKIDDLRKKRRLPALQTNDALVAAAKHHADYLERSNLMSHSELNLRYRTPQNRAEKFGFRNPFVGENIAQSYITFGSSFGGRAIADTYDDVANDLVDLWVHSPGHHQNLLRSSYVTTGVAVAVDFQSGKIYAVQVFGGKAAE